MALLDHRPAARLVTLLLAVALLVAGAVVVYGTCSSDCSSPLSRIVAARWAQA